MGRVRGVLVIGVLALASMVVAGPAAAPVFAQAPPAAGATVFVLSAHSGQLGGGRLTLHGVGRRVTWAHVSGRSGVLRVERMHRLLFSSGTPAASGTLHVAGDHGGDELTFRLTRPRYNAARGTVSYAVKQSNHGRLPGRTARAAGAPQQFGAASLSLVGGGATQQLLFIDPSTRNCDPVSTAQCWGTLQGSGLPANTPWQVHAVGLTDLWMTGNADANGNVNVNLMLPCNVAFPAVWVTAQPSPSETIETEPPTASTCH